MIPGFFCPSSIGFRRKTNSYVSSWAWRRSYMTIEEIRQYYEELSKTSDSHVIDEIRFLLSEIDKERARARRLAEIVLYLRRKVTTMTATALNAQRKFDRCTSPITSEPMLISGRYRHISQTKSGGWYMRRKHNL
jgi:hypothetical protein